MEGAGLPLMLILEGLSEEVFKFLITNLIYHLSLFSAAVLSVLFIFLGISTLIETESASFIFFSNTEFGWICLVLASYFGKPSDASSGDDDKCLEEWGSDDFLENLSLDIRNGECEPFSENLGAKKELIVLVLVSTALDSC